MEFKVPLTRQYLMQNLNDMFLFAKVIEHGGFTAASKILDIPKSRLSRRIALLEAGLGVKLINRTTRQMHLTDLGQQFYQYCQNILIEAQVAEEVILNAHEIPSGLVTISCPELLAKRFLANVIGRFLQQHPQIQIHLVSTNRIVNLFSEGVDIAIRVREKIEDSAYYIAQPVCQVKQLIVASPELISQYSVPHSPQELQSLPFVSTSQRKWVLEDPLVKSNFTLIIDKPKLVSDDLSVLLQVAQQGLGVTILPYPIVLEGLNNGRLVNILPKHIASWGVLHLVYANRLGRTPAAKLLLDFLVQEMRAHFSV